MFKSSSTSLILIGVLALIIGIVAIAWPGVTILALVILFAVYAFADAGLQTMRAFSSRSAGPVLGHLLLAVVGLGAGLFALAWPAPTAYVLVIGGAPGPWSAARPSSSPVSRPGRARAPARCSCCPGWCRSCSACCCSPGPASAR